MILEELVYLSRDNIIELSLTVDGTPIDHTIINRVKIKVGSTVLDSNTAPLLFDMTNTNRLILKLATAGITAGRYNSELVIYDATHSNGLFWSELVVIVKAA
jgi:hypothetical protein